MADSRYTQIPRSEGEALRAEYDQIVYELDTFDAMSEDERQRLNLRLDELAERLRWAVEV